MPIQFSTTVRNARLDAIETAIGASPKLQLRSGPPPASCAAADTGTLLAEMVLPADFMAAAANGSKVIAGGPWTFTGAADGAVGHYRLKDATGATCHEQGTVTATGGAGDLELDNVNIATGQNGSITSWTKTEGNA